MSGGACYPEKKARRKKWFDWFGFLGFGEVSSLAWPDLGFFRRFGSRILRELIARKPDVVGLFWA